MCKAETIQTGATEDIVYISSCFCQSGFSKVSVVKTPAVMKRMSMTGIPDWKDEEEVSWRTMLAAEVSGSWRRSISVRTLTDDGEVNGESDAEGGVLERVVA